MKRAFRNRMEINRDIRVARGLDPADLVIRGARYLNVFTCEWMVGDLAVRSGRIVGIGDGKKNSYEGLNEINLKGKWIVPGFIDSHVHLESSMMSPENFEAMALMRGTTGAVLDPHEIANVLGVEGLRYILNAAELSTIDFYVMLSSCVPATDHLETSGAKLLLEDLKPFKNHPHVLGLAEMMNFPGLLNGDQEVLKKIEAFQDTAVDGHCPLLGGKDLNAYISAGISSCHESLSVAEAREKLEKGMLVQLREGSVAKNLAELSQLLTAESSPRLSLATDDRNPLDIAKEGHIDYLIRLAIKKKRKPTLVYRAASWSPAVHYGLKKKGAIAPGYDADLVVLEDFRTVKIHSVMKDGLHIRSQKDLPHFSIPAPEGNSVLYEIPDLRDFEVRGQDGEYRTIGVVPNQIVTRELHMKLKSSKGVVQPDLEKDVLKICVLERHGNGKPLSHGWVQGFGLKSGALGSTVGHDSHNAVAVGTNDRDMRLCFEWLKTYGGGFVVAKNGRVVASLALPIAGLMTSAPAADICKAIVKIRAEAKKLGCGLHEPLLQLAFLCLPVIPDLKITDLGLVDVRTQSFVPLFFR